VVVRQPDELDRRQVAGDVVPELAQPLIGPGVAALARSATSLRFVSGEGVIEVPSPTWP
jgi:hypothetical protein